MFRIEGQSLSAKNILAKLNSENVEDTFTQNGIGSEINQYVSVQSISNCTNTLVNSIIK